MKKQEMCKHILKTYSCSLTCNERVTVRTHCAVKYTAMGKPQHI